MAALQFDSSNYTLLTNDSDLRDGMWLFLLHATKIPPHIGISLNGRYFSLKANGKDQDLPVHKLIDLIHRKCIPTLCVEIEQTEEHSFSRLKEVFASFDLASASGQSCLAPVERFTLGTNGSERLHDFLNKLHGLHSIRRVFGLHLSSDFQGIPEYTKKEIDDRLNYLHGVTRKAHLP